MSVPIDYAAACRHLAQADPVIGALIEAHGPCGLASRPPEKPLRALTRAIVSQQLSVKAADTIFGRFVALFPNTRFPTPEQILAVSRDQLRAVGLSRPKAAYLHDLSERVVSGRLPLDTLDAMSDDEVIETLTAVKGIGRWTAEMVLIFQLGRPDILPVDDVGLLRAMHTQYHLRRRPSPERVLRLGKPWRPYRSIASWYLWASL
jgi:DNA-3-methyladenine glycosylase II